MLYVDDIFVSGPSKMHEMLNIEDSVPAGFRYDASDVAGFVRET